MRLGIKVKSLLWCASLFINVFSSPVMSDINFDGETRFIYDSKQKQKKITVVNTGVSAVLVQVTIEPGTADQSGGSLFMALSKSVMRVEPNERESFDVVYQGVGLPGDKESYFLLSFLEIPQQPTDGQILQIALRHRLKLFFRPAIPVDIDTAVSRFYWLRGKSSAYLKVHNDTPYYRTLTDIQLLGAQDEVCGSRVEHLMIAPLAAQTVHSSNCRGAVKKVRYTIITDDGGMIEKTTTVNEVE